MVTGNEFLDNAIESKRQADRKRAILLAISISKTDPKRTANFVYFLSSFDTGNYRIIIIWQNFLNTVPTYVANLLCCQIFGKIPLALGQFLYVVKFFSGALLGNGTVMDYKLDQIWRKTSQE